MQAITVPRTGMRGLAFTGEELADVATSSDRAHPDYSGATGRAARVRLYRTAEGQYVAAVTHYSQWQGELPELHQAHVFADGDALCQWIEAEAPLPAWGRDALLAAAGIAPERVA